MFVFTIAMFHCTSTNFLSEFLMHSHMNGCRQWEALGCHSVSPLLRPQVSWASRAFADILVSNSCIARCQLNLPIFLLDLHNAQSSLKSWAVTGSIVKAGSQYDTTCAMWGIKRAYVRRNRMQFYSCLSCIHTLCHTVNQPLQ